jgi:hypothetical protein
MKTMLQIDLEAMRNVDVRTVDPSALADIDNVKIDVTKPKNERIIDFIRQVKNPYCYMCGETVVKVSYTNTGRTFEEIFKSIITNT